MTTLLALYRRPDGGPEAQVTFARRYASSGLSQRPAVTDLLLAASMAFDGRAALDAGPALGSRRSAGRNLREIAPGLATLLVLEDVPEMIAGASLPVDTVETTSEGPS